MLSVKTSPVDVGTDPPPHLHRPSQVVQEATNLFVTALTNDSAPAWKSLLDHLASLPTAKLRELALQPEIQHYIHRAVQHEARHFSHLGIFEKLGSLFPEAVERYREEELLCSYSYSNLDTATMTTVLKEERGRTEVGRLRLKKKRKRAVTIGAAPRELFTFSPSQVPVTYRGPTLKLKDLAPAASLVSNEMITAERNSLHFPLPLQGVEGPMSVAVPRPHSSQGFNRPLLSPILSSAFQGTLPSPDISPNKSVSFQLTGYRTLVRKPLRLKTGYDVIEAYSSGRLHSESESVYLNYANSVPWNPYDLTVVPKTRANPEHFVVSKFGVLHVYPNGDSDLQNFAEWLREAGLCTLVRHIQFFRRYLLQKLFSQWHRMVRYSQFVRVRFHVGKSSLKLFPHFSTALLRIQCLSEELLTVPFHTLVPLGGYSQEMFDRNLQSFHAKAERFLQRYFKYCRRVIAEAIESTQSLALELETEKRHQPFVSELPISIQKEKHTKLERDLATAQYRANKIGDFVTLADQMVISCLLKLARSSMQSWIDITLRHAAIVPVNDASETNSETSTTDVGSERDSRPIQLGKGSAFLCAQMTFDESGTITTHPSLDELESTLIGPLHDIIQIISCAVQPLTGIQCVIRDGASPRPTSRGPESPTRAAASPVDTMTLWSASSRPSTKQSMMAEEQKPPTPVPVKNAASKTREKAIAMLARSLPNHKSKSLMRALQGIPTVQENSLKLENERAGMQLDGVLDHGSDDRREIIGKLGQRACLLTREDFQTRLEQDPLVSSAVENMQVAVSGVTKRVESLCLEYGWLKEVWQFVLHWERQEKGDKFSPEDFQTTLTKLYEWNDHLSHLPPQLPTLHSLVSVVTSGVVDYILPRLVAILDWLKSTGVGQARREGERVLGQTQQHSEALFLKRYDLEGFADYANELRKSQAFRNREASAAHYVLRVHSVLQCHGVEVPGEDKALGQELQRTWGVFEQRLGEAEEFVSVQTPVKAQGLQESIMSCEEELRSLVSRVNEGEFVDPSAPPYELIDQLESLKEVVMGVRARLLGLSKWKEAITGQPHNLSTVSSLMDMLFMRQELWKYRRVFDGYENDWMKAPFKKLDIPLLSEKVCDWLLVCSKLEKTLPHGDPVLEGWKERLTELKLGMPLLQQLSSKALRTSHWYTIFAALGEDYFPLHPYTLTDFTLYNVFEHSEIIFEICHDAMQEKRLREQVTELQEVWSSKTVTILQTPLDHYPFALTPPSSHSRPSTPKKARDKTTTFAIAFDITPHPSQTADYLFTMGNDSDIILSLEDSIIHLKLLLVSPHLGSLKGKAESLLVTLRQLRELFTLMADCQQKWLDLLCLFLPMDDSLRHSCGLTLLQHVSTRFQEVTQSIHDDPRVLSLLGKRRGQKGIRELQGDSLRQTLQGCLDTLGVIQRKVHSQLEEACFNFPRLCYLQENDIIHVISHHGSPNTIHSLMSRVFPSISSVRFTEVISSNSPTRIGTDDDDGFQIISVEGRYGETLPLVVPLPLGKQRAPRWLRALEGAIRYSLACVLTQSLATLPDCLMGVNGPDSVSSLHQWLSSHPQQTLLLALELNCTAAMHSALTSEEPLEQLKELSSKLHSATNIAVETLRGLTMGHTRTLFIMLQNIVTTLKHKTEMVTSLGGNETPSVDSFYWTNHIHYSIGGVLSPQPNEKLSARSSMASLYNVTGGTSLKSSHSSLDQQSLVTPHKHSVYSLVASSKSLLTSRHTLSGNQSKKASPLRAISHMPTNCMVHTGSNVVPYGFEYYGCDWKLVVAPPTEAHLVLLTSAISGYTFPSVSGPQSVGKTESTLEVSKVLGRHCYQFHCSALTGTDTIHRLLAASLKTGSILILEGYLTLQHLVLVSLGQWLCALKESLTNAFVSVGPPRSAAQSRPSEHSEITLPTISPSPRPASTMHPSRSLHSSSPHDHTVTSRVSTRIDWYGERTLGDWSLSMGDRADFMFDGQSLSACSTFGCVLVDCTGVGEAKDIPEQLKSALRPIHLLTPDMQYVTEVLLMGKGFSEAYSLGRKLTSFMDHLENQMSVNSNSCSYGLHGLKRVITHAADYLRDSLASTETDTDVPSLESTALSHGVMLTYASQVSPGDSSKLQDLLESYFPSTHGQGSRSGEDPVLMEAVQAQLRERHLQQPPALMEKIHQLHHSLSHHACAILTGSSGSGKTTCYQILVAAYQHIRELAAAGRMKLSSPGDDSSHCVYPKVDVTVINPGAYSLEELVGNCQKDTRGVVRWKDGILTRLLRQVDTVDSLKTTLKHPDIGPLLQTAVTQGCEDDSVRHWIVFDGPMDPSLMESLTALISHEGLCTPNGEKLALPVSCQVVVETPSLSHLPPSLLTQCALVHCGHEVMTSEALVDTWLDRAPTQHNLSAISTETLATMIKQLLPDTMDFIQDTNTKHGSPLYTTQLQSQVYGITETRCLLNFLSAVLERNAPKVESSYSHAGTASRVSSSYVIDSRASSAMRTYSASSMQGVHDSPRVQSHQASRVDVVESEAFSLGVDHDDAISECSNLEAEIGLTMQIRMATMLAFAYIWSVGAFVPFSEVSSFDEFSRDQIMQLPFAVPLPEEGSVFDYYLDLRRYEFLPWRERHQERSSGGYITLPELDRFAYIVDLYLSYGLNVMIVGERGSGKTSFVENLIHSRMPLTRLPITHTLTPPQLQGTILDKVAQIEKRAGQRLGTKKSTTVQQRCVFFLDDLHLASTSQGGPQLLEAIRYTASHESLPDLTRNYQHDLHNVRFIASCVPQGLSGVAPRLYQVFNPVPFLPPSDECLHQIFSRSVLLWLQQFPESAVGDAEVLAEAIGAASVVVFRSITGKLRPSPSQPHYLFTMHDILHVYEGLLLMSPETKAQAQPQFSLLNRRGFLSSTLSGRRTKTARKAKTMGKLKSGRKEKSSLPSLRGSEMRKPKIRGQSLPGDADQLEMTTTVRMLLRLWSHENTRVYVDRLVDSRDRIWFQKLLETCMKYCFCGLDLQGGETTPQPLMGHSAARGRRIRSRGGRMRSNILPQSEGPNLADLASSGIKMDTLQKLVPREGGPRQLIPYDQLMVRGEDLTGLIFAHLPSASQATGGGEEDNEDSAVASVGYSELGDGQVMEALNRHLEHYRSSEHREVVLFRGAIEHAMRLCRTMSLPGSHTLLLGPKGTGRKSLTRLVAHIMDAQLFELTVGDQKSQLREVCISAGLERRHTVLLVTSSVLQTGQIWESVCELMNRGLCAGLFTSSELLVMSSKLQQGKMKKTTDGAQQAFARSVRKNLHVVVTWDLETKSCSIFKMADRGVLEESSRAVFASLCQTCSHVDHYLPWSKQAYSEVALQCWQGASQPKWQDWADTSSQLEAVSTLAAHVHLTSMELLQRTLPNIAGELVSPKMFMECLRMTQSIAIELKAQEKAAADGLETALGRLEEVDRTVYELEQGMATLRPQLAAAEEEVQQRMGLITTAKERYMAANRRCKFAEETIETETSNVEHLSRAVEERFQKVSPVYHSALEALSSVQKNDVMEVMSYREPPAALTTVFDALCMLFDRPQTWEDCKQLLLSRNFFESLIFFDKDNVPKHKLRKLDTMITREQEFESVEHGSTAVVPLYKWVTALVDYHRARTVVQPYRKKLAEAEKTLVDANKTFIAMRKDMMETKRDLEETVKLHKESVQKARKIETEIDKLQTNLDKANHLLSTMSQQRRNWDEQLKFTKSRIDSVPGHALFCAASISYLSRLPPDNHQELKNNWLAYCSGGVSLGSLAVGGHQGLQSSQPHHGLSSQQQVVRIQKDFSSQNVLSSKDERAHWQQESIFPDHTTLERCLAARACCNHGTSHWPLIFDPNRQFQRYLEALEAQRLSGTSSNVSSEHRNESQNALDSKEDPTHTILRVSEVDVAPKLKDAISQGAAVMLLLDCATGTADYTTSSDATTDNDALLNRIMRRDFSRDSSGHVYLEVDDETIPVHRDLCLYIVIEHSLDTLPSSLSTIVRDLCHFSVVDLSLSVEGLQRHFQRLIVSSERPEYGIRYKSVLTDLILHQQQMEKSQEDILEHMNRTEGSLFGSSSLLPTLRECESSKYTASEQITETNKILRSFDRQVQVYRPLADYTAILFTVVQKISCCFKYVRFSLGQFEELIGSLLARDRKVPDNAMAIAGHVLHLKHQFLHTLSSKLQIHLFKRHHILLPLLVSLESLLGEGKLSPVEYQLLAGETAPIEAQLDAILSSPSVDKPKWITDKVWCEVMGLKNQKQLPAFRRLMTEITNNSEEWKEYFELPPSLLAPVPSLGDSVSLCQKLILWKTFRPDKFAEVITDFILLTLGADITTPHSPAVEVTLPHTQPDTPIICLLPEEASDPMGAIKDAAQARKTSLHSVSVVNGTSLENLSLQLPGFISEGWWVAVEHCHLCDDWEDKLESLLLQVVNSDALHPNFRLWVLLPVSVCSATEFNSSCFMVALDDSQDLTHTAGGSHGQNTSPQLLQDINLVVTTSSPKSPTQWEGYETVISKIQKFVPSPLDEAELDDMNIQKHGHSQSLLSLMFEELCNHNRALVAVHGSLKMMLDFLKGDVPFSASFGRVMTVIRGNTLPAEWQELLALLKVYDTTELIPVLRLLKSRMQFYCSSLQSGRLPVTFDPLWFSNPSDLLSRVVHEFAQEYQLPGDAVCLQTKLIPGRTASERAASLSDVSLVFSGLQLHGASWNGDKHCLEPPILHDTGSIGQEYCVSVSPVSIELAPNNTRNIPVFLSPEHRGSGPIFNLPLEISDTMTGAPGSVVYLSCRPIS